MHAPSRPLVIFQFLILLLLVIDLSAQPGLEEKIGQATLASVEQVYGFYENEALLEYVKSIGRKLEAQVPENPYEFKYFLVNTPEPNAFATAGGYVFVNRGIFPVIDTEDELAGILGHEFTHVIRKHSTKKMYRGVIPAILKVPVDLLGNVFPSIVGDLISVPIDLTAQTTGAAFSRRQENEADAYGIGYAAGAGYDPEGLKSALEKLEAYGENRYKMKEHFTIFMDHPLTQDRVKRLEALQERYSLDAVDPTLMMHHMDGILMGQDPAQGMILPDHSFVHPDLDIFIQLPSGWQIENTTEALTAVEQSGYTGFVIGVEEQSNRIDSAAILMAGRLQEAGLHAVTSEPYMLNGREAIDLTVTGEDINRYGKTQFTWIQLESPRVILHCMGMAHSEEQFGNIRGIISSIRGLEPSDREQIVREVLYVGEGGDESLSEFAARMGEDVAGNLDLIAIINNISPSDNVRGRQVKYIRTEPY